jgi:Flp pilus assembly pilin Flp
MFHTARALATMWQQRWQAMRSDEGATVIEYAILVLMGFLMAGVVAVAVTNAVRARSNQIQ